MRTRLITTLTLSTAVLLFGAVSALAAGGLSATRSAAIAQYEPPPPPPPLAQDSARGHGSTTTETTTDATTPSNVNPPPIGSPEPEPEAPVLAERTVKREPEKQVQAARQTAQIPSGALPFTGYAGIGMLLIALAFLWGGLGLRRAARQD